MTKIYVDASASHIYVLSATIGTNQYATVLAQPLLLTSALLDSTGTASSVNVENHQKTVLLKFITQFMMLSPVSASVLRLQVNVMQIIILIAKHAVVYAHQTFHALMVITGIPEYVVVSTIS